MVNEQKILQIYSDDPQRGFKLLMDCYQEPVYYYVKNPQSLVSTQVTLRNTFKILSVKASLFAYYKNLYEDAKSDMDIFFQKANELPGVKAEIIVKGHVYHLIFLECTCDLCKKGYVTTPLLCECSRQSVLYSLQTFWKEQKFKVTLCHSILQGAQNCKIRIEVL